MESVDEIMNEISKLELEMKVANEQRRAIVNRIQKMKSKLDGLRNKLNTIKTNEVSSINWAKNSYEWDEKIDSTLENTFKLKEFRSHQRAAINATLSGKDVIIVMPTGGGKSLCYQLPVVVSNGLTVVVSPLVSLIDDQILSLKKYGIEAVTINSSNSKSVAKNIYDALIKGPTSFKLLYVTPEWMAKSKRFMSCLQKCYQRKGLDRFAIDEVHCCSQWGHDFRPDYKFIGILKNLFSDIPIMGLTATATESVILDVQEMLQVQGCVVLKAHYNRPNLYYEVKVKPPNQEKCIDLLHSLLTKKYKDQSGIIYTTTVNDSIDIAKDLKARGVKVACYHANLDADVRQKIHVKWLDNIYQVVVATVAFGMGIDKPDVRFVIHHAIPKSMENYYQESGRAGRDDKNADCILLYSLKDTFRISSMVSTTFKGTQDLYHVLEFCIDAKKCRRSMIASYFDEVWIDKDCNKMCDHCKKTGYETKDITKYVKIFRNIIDYARLSDTKLTAIKLLDAFFKTGPSKNVGPPDLPKPLIPKNLAENIIAFMLINRYLRENIVFTPYNTISYMDKGPKECEEMIYMNYSRCLESSTSASSSNTNHDTDYHVPKKRSKRN